MSYKVESYSTREWRIRKSLLKEEVMADLRYYTLICQQGLRKDTKTFPTSYQRFEPVTLWIGNN